MVSPYLPWIFVVLLLLTLLILAKVQFRLQYSRNQENDHLSIQVYMWKGLINHRLRVPAIKLKKKHLVHIRLKQKLQVENASGEKIYQGKNQLDVSGLKEIYHKIEHGISLLKEYQNEIGYFLNHLKIRQLSWSTNLGVGDAAVTGLLTGVVWTIKSNLVSGLYQNVSEKNSYPHLQVEPDFQGRRFSTAVDCIFVIRIGYIMATGAKIIMKKVISSGG